MTDVVNTKKAIADAIAHAFGQAHFDPAEIATYVEQALVADTPATGTYEGHTAQEWHEAYIAEAIAHQTNLNNIHAGQQYRRANETTIFAVETPDGYKHQGSDFNTAQSAVELYDDAYVVCRTHSNWQRVNPATTAETTEKDN